MKLVFLLKLTFAIAVTSPNYQSTTSLNSITDEPQNSYKLRNVTKVQLETRKSLKGPPQDKKIDSDKHGKEKLPGSQECQGQLYEDKAGINESLENLLPLARQNTDISIIQENYTNASNINDKEMLVKRQKNSRYAKSIYTLQRSSSGQLFSGEEAKKFVSEINVSSRSTNKQYISTYGSVLVAPTNSPKIGTVNDGNYSEYIVLNKENTSFTETWKRSQKNLKPLYSLSKLLKRQTHLQYAEVSDNSYTSLLRKIHETNNISSTKNTKLLKVERFLSPSSSMINVQTQLRPQTEQEKSKNPENFTTHLLPPAFVTKEGNISPESFSTNVNQSSDVYLGMVKVGGTENKMNETLGENSQDVVVNVPRKTKLGQKTIAEQILQLDAHKKYDIPDRKNNPHLLHNTRYYSDIIPERGSQGKQNNVTLLEVYDYKREDAKENSTFYKIMPFSTEKAFNRNPESIHTSAKGTTKFLSQAISTTMPSARNLNLINDPTTKYILLRGTDPSHRNIKSIIEHPQKHLLSEDNIHPTINENKAHQKRELLPKVIKANVVKRTSLKEGTGRISSENLSQDNEGDNAVLPENEMLRDYRTSSSTQDVSGENPWNFQITTPIAQTSATADNPCIALAITDEVFKQENTFRTTTHSVSDDSETALSPQTAIGGDSGLETTTSLQLTRENSQTTTELLDHISLRSLLSGDLTTPFSLHKSANLLPQSPDVPTRTSINSNDFGILKYRNETSRKIASPIADLKARLDPRSRNKSSDTFTALAPPGGLESYPDLYGTFFTQEIIYPGDNASSALNLSAIGGKVMPEMPWPVKKEAVVEGDLVLGGLMMVHEREDTVTCGPVMPQGGIQALEAMLYTLDRVNFGPEILLPNITIGAHILDDCDKDTYGLEMAVDFIKGCGSIANL